MSQQLSLREARTKRQKNTSYKHSRLKFRSTLKPSRSEHSPSDPEDEKTSQRKKIMKLDTEGEGSVDVTMGIEVGEKSNIAKEEEDDADMPDVTKGTKHVKGGGGTSATITAPIETKQQEKKEEDKEEEKDGENDEEKEEEKEDEKDDEKDEEKDEDKDEDKDDDNDDDENKEKDEETDEKKDESDGEPEEENEEKDKDENDEDDKDSEDSEDEKNAQYDVKETDDGKEEDDEDMSTEEEKDDSTDESDSKQSKEDNKNAMLPNLIKKKTKPAQDKRLNKNSGGPKDYRDELSGDDSEDPFSYLKTKEGHRLTLELFEKFKNVKDLGESEDDASEISTSTVHRNTENEDRDGDLDDSRGDISSSESDNDGDSDDSSGGHAKGANSAKKSDNEWRRNEYNDSKDETTDDESDVEETEIEKNVGQNDVTEEDENKADANAAKAEDTEANNVTIKTITKPFIEIEVEKTQCVGLNYFQDDGIRASGASTSNDTVDKAQELSASDIEKALDPYDVDDDEADNDPSSNEEDYCEFLSEDGASGGDDDMSFRGDDDFFDEVEELRGTG